jgi:amidohydrolase
MPTSPDPHQTPSHTQPEIIPAAEEEAERGEPVIRGDVQDIFEELVTTRRYLHQRPELSLKEFETAKYLNERLSTIKGLEVQAFIGAEEEGARGTGLVAVLQGGAGPGPCIALRADMDGLPVPETTGLPFASQNAGVMHACGHDGHMAIMLHVAELLASRRDRLRGSIKFIFQPAEECYGGARHMIRDGCLDGVQEVYGLHLWNYLPTGTVSVKNGPFMANSDRFYITVTGRGGHGASPQGTVDAIVVAAHLVTTLQTIVSRSTDPLEPKVITIGTINGGHVANAIADEVKLGGTVRTMAADTQAVIMRRMRAVCDGVSATYDAAISLDYQVGYPFVNNSCSESVGKVRRACACVVERDFIYEQPSMAAEDFAYYLHKVPGCFFFIGSAPSWPVQEQHHKSNFTINETDVVVVMRGRRRS